MNLDKILYRILLGYYYISIDDQEYKIIYPSLDIKYRAEMLYDKIIEDNKFDKRLLTEKEISVYLKINNIWKPSDQEALDKCKKLIDDTKIDLFINYTNEKNRNTLKKQLSQTNEELNKLFINKNSMNYLGINDHATSVKNEFIIMNTIYDNNDKLVFNNPYKDSHEYQRLQKFIREIVENALDISMLRVLVKSDVWRSFVGCVNLVKQPNEVNDDYRYLVGLHKMYDSVRQHPECPSEDIINDDDALDGWFLFNSRKAEKEKKKNAILNKVRGNSKDAGEVFIVTDDIKEKQEIYDLNDAKGRSNIKEMLAIANKEPDNKDYSVKWNELPFVQRDLRQQAQKLHDNKGK